MTAFLLQLVLSFLPQQTCLNNYGKVACGYNCIAAHGELGCAQTSSGVCSSSDRDLLCWDPPDSVRAHYGDRVPAAQCITRSGNIACGYNCVARDGGQVQCSSTPDGVCVVTSRGITCWDPPMNAYCADTRPLPRPKCITVDGNAACGYNCITRNGEFNCANTPGGVCTPYPNQLVCTDPEAPPMCGAVPCRPDDPISGRWWCRPNGKP